MRKTLLASVALIFLVSASAMCQTKIESVNTTKPTDLKPETIQCDTLIDWYPDPQQAFEEARRTGRPVYVLHLSGNLRNETFT